MRHFQLSLLGLIFCSLAWSIFAIVSVDDSQQGNICLTNRFPTLMYHHIREYTDFMNKSARDISVSPAEFRAQMSYLTTAGYHTITPADISGNMVPCGSVMITFDDGYYDNFLYAFPILESLRYRAVASIIIAHLDESDYMTGGDIQTLQAAGWEIASHTWHHHFLTHEPVTTFGHEIGESKIMLEKWFGSDVSTLVYPGGYYGPETLKHTQNAGYTYAFTTQFGESDLSGSRLELKRIHIGPGTTVEAFKGLLEKAATMQ